MKGKGGVSINSICLLEPLKESEDGKKLQDLGVAGFRVWFGQFLVQLWFFDKRFSNFYRHLADKGGRGSSYIPIKK